MAYSLEEISKHNSVKSCWVVIKNKVYDVTEFLPEHPGGATIILKYAGKDATAVYEPIHPPDALEKNLPPEKRLGALDSQGTEKLRQAVENRIKTKDEIRVEEALKRRPPLSRILSLHEMEDVARKVLSYKALAYYSSAGDDETSYIENSRGFSRIFFHPRVMRPISICNPSTTILGYQSRIPVFVSGAALAKLGHPLGEVNITRGAGRTSIIQMVSSNASLSAEQIAQARLSPSQPIFFQLYKHKDNEVAAKRVREIESLGYKAIFLTVDAPIAGNRERDIRAPYELEQMENAIPVERNANSAGESEFVEQEPDILGTAGGLLKNDDLDLSWDKTIAWLRSVTKLPIVLKGIQCVEDAVLAADSGVDGILISNHGGRQLEYSLPSIEVLYRLRQQRPDVFDKLEVYMDGGVRRGTDVVKALCLGAKAVGLGRPFLYAQSAYGEAGVVKIVNILEREIINCMRLMGATNVNELVPEMVEQINWQPATSKL